jgi:hypothetical protein
MTRTAKKRTIGVRKELDTARARGKATRGQPICGSVQGPGSSGGPLHERQQRPRHYGEANVLQHDEGVEVPVLGLGLGLGLGLRARVRVSR